MLNMSECFVCLAGDGVLVEPCRCATHAHAACLAPAIAGSDGHCRVCLAEFRPDAMCAVLRLSLMRHWTPRAHYCYTWGLVRARRAAEALLQLGSIDHAALEHEPGSVANCFVMKGRALLLLGRTEDAVDAFQQAAREIAKSQRQVVDVEVLTNAKIGLVYAHTKQAKYLHAQREATDASKLCQLASAFTTMKVYHAISVLASAQGNHVQAFAFLLRRHKIALEASKDVVLHTETLVEAHLARSFIPVRKKPAPHEICRLLRIIRRTGRQEIVIGAARWLASRVQPAQRLRGKRHPELVEQRRGRRMGVRRR